MNGVDRASQINTAGDHQAAAISTPKAALLASVKYTFGMRPVRDAFDVRELTLDKQIDPFAAVGDRQCLRRVRGRISSVF